MGNDKKISSDDILKSLIRLARQNSDEDFIRPDDETIAAYLDGIATDAQKQVMEKALIASSDFRKEIRDMANDIDIIEQKDYSQPIESRKEPETPKYENFVSKTKKSVRKNEERTSLLVQISEIFQNRMVPVYAIAAVAFIIIIVLLIPFLSHKDSFSRWSLVENNYPKNYLTSNKTRSGVGVISKNIYESAFEAAVSEFRFLLYYRKGDLLLRPRVSFINVDSTLRPICVTFIGKADKSPENFISYVPRSTRNDVDSLEAWLLTLPSRNIYKLNLLSDSTAVIWDNSFGLSGCITITFYDRSGFRAVMGNTFEIE